jgi:hypothetical protein
MTHRRVLKKVADIPKAVQLVIPKIFCSYVKSWLATAPMKQFYQQSCPIAKFLIRLPTALSYKGFALGGIVISLRILPDVTPAESLRERLRQSAGLLLKKLKAVLEGRGFRLKIFDKSLKGIHVFQWFQPEKCKVYCCQFNRCT